MLNIFTMVMDNKYMNSSETAQYLNMSRSYLYAMTRKGVIPCFRPFGKKMLFRKTDLDAFISKTHNL